MDIRLSDYPLVIDIALIVIILAIVITLVTALFIYLNRVETKKNRRKVQNAEQIILDELSENLLIYDHIAHIPEKELDQAVSRLNRLKGSRLFQETLIDLMLYLRRNFTGGLARTINSIYSRLKLRKFSLQKLNSWFWFNKAQGLKEVREMKDIHSMPQVYKLVNDPNIDVRVTAYSALIQFQAKECFDFMRQEKEQLTEWHQILLLDTIDKASGLEVPDFKHFLSSENFSIVHLCAKLIMHYKQFNAIPWIISLLNHEDPDVRIQLIRTLGSLHAEEAEEKLAEIYPAQETRIKSEILQALMQIASGRSIPFLKEQFLHSAEFLLIRDAARAIFSHPRVNNDQVFEQVTTLSPVQQQIIKHFNEPINLYGIH